MQENEYVVDVNVRERRKIDKFNCCFLRSMEIHIPHLSILVFILVLISKSYLVLTLLERISSFSSSKDQIEINHIDRFAETAKLFIENLQKSADKK